MFFNYLRALNVNPIQSFIGKRSSVLFMTVLAMLIIFPALGVYDNPIACISVLLMFCALANGALRNVKPSVSALVPISSKRKMLYDFIIALLSAVIVILAVTVIVSIIFLITVGATGSSISAEFNEMFSGFNSNRNGNYYDIAFACEFAVIVYFGGMAVGFVKKYKHRSICLAALFGLIFVGLICMALPASIAYKYETSSSIHLVSPFSVKCFSAMQCPQACIAVYAVIAAAAIVSAIWLGLRYYDNKKF